MPSTLCFAIRQDINKKRKMNARHYLSITSPMQPSYLASAPPSPHLSTADDCSRSQLSSITALPCPPYRRFHSLRPHLLPPPAPTAMALSIILPTSGALPLRQ